MSSSLTSFTGNSWASKDLHTIVEVHVSEYKPERPPVRTPVKYWQPWWLGFPSFHIGIELQRQDTFCLKMCSASCRYLHNKRSCSLVQHSACWPRHCLCCVIFKIPLLARWSSNRHWPETTCRVTGTIPTKHTSGWVAQVSYYIAGAANVSDKISRMVIDL